MYPHHHIPHRRTIMNEKQTAGDSAIPPPASTGVGAGSPGAMEGTALMRLCALRTYSRPQEMPLRGADEAGEAEVAYQEESEAWEVIRTLLPDEHERRLAYLLYHCGLKPREIIHYCPQEFSEVQEIYRLRRNIMERLVGNADRIRWRRNVERWAYCLGGGRDLLV